MKKIKTAFLCILAVTASAQVIDSKAEQIVSKLAEQTSSYHSITIEFDFEMKNEAQGINEKLSGKLWIKGDKYKIEMMGQTVICDGKTTWAINEEIEEVHISSVDPKDEEASPAKLLTSYDKNYRPKLIREQMEGGKMVQTIDLTPIQGKSFYKIRIRIDKNQNRIISSTIYEKDQTTFTYTVNTFNTTSRLDDSFFIFQKSLFPGYEVIDMR